MNWDQIKGQWKQMKGVAQSKWGELTEDDANKIEGNRERLVGLIQERYGVAREDAERSVDEWAQTL